MSTPTMDEAAKVLADPIRTVPLRRRSRTQQASGVRLRRALLSRRGLGADGNEQPLHRAAAPPGLHRVDRPTRTQRDDIRRRPQAPADSLLAEVISALYPRWTCR